MTAASGQGSEQDLPGSEMVPSASDTGTPGQPCQRNGRQYHRRNLSTNENGDAGQRERSQSSTSSDIKLDVEGKESDPKWIDGQKTCNGTIVAIVRILLKDLPSSKSPVIVISQVNLKEEIYGKTFSCLE